MVGGGVRVQGGPGGSDTWLVLRRIDPIDPKGQQWRNPSDQPPFNLNPYIGVRGRIRSGPREPKSCRTGKGG